MKIIHFVSGLNLGGTEKLVYDVCKNSHKYKLGIILLSLYGGNFENEFRNLNIPVYILNPKRKMDVKVLYRIRKIILENRISLIHTHEPTCFIYSLFASIGLSIKKIHTFHGYSYKSAINDLFHKIVCKYSDELIFVSKGFLERYKQKFILLNTKCNIIYNGIDFSQLDLVNRNSNNKKNSNINVIGMLGHVAPRKDQITICKATKYLVENYSSDIKVLFVGSIENKTIYQNCVSFIESNRLNENILFLGFRKDAMNLLRDFDIHIVSSKLDTFGVSAIEGMYLGIPTVLSDIKPFIEISDNGRAALLFRQGDHIDLSKAVIKILNNEDYRLNLIRYAKIWVQNKFSIETHIKELKAVYEHYILR